MLLFEFLFVPKLAPYKFNYLCRKCVLSAFCFFNEFRIMSKRVTELNAILADWDEQFYPNGTEKFFSVGFIAKTGEYIFIKRARRCGLRFSMKDLDFKVAVPVDNNGIAIAHVYPIWIHSILYYKSNI